MAINKGISSSNALNERMKKYNIVKQPESKVINKDPITQNFGGVPSGTMYGTV